LDVLDELGIVTGRTVVRGAPLQPGEFHRVVHVWLRNETGEYLVQQRAPDLAADPGIWATTAGCVLAGEASLAAALRETREELGLELPATGLRLFRRLTVENRIVDVWLGTVPGGPGAALSLGPEVGAVRWATKHAIEQMIHGGEFFPYRYFAQLPG
jgi:8-oxo-dGTP pyrophosphatase MutT (NUDIX family)